MSSLKINSRLLLITFFIFSNSWIYRIIKENFAIGLLVITASFLIGRFWDSENSFKVILISLAVLILFQYQTTQPQSLTILENDEQRVQQERIRGYPPTYIDLYFKVVWLKPAEWIEKNNYVIALSKVEQNIFENLDLNKYFFGGSPRNKPDDFEKFPFFLLPLFILGIFGIVREEKYMILGILLILPLGLLTYIGNKNSLGPFVLFPFFIFLFAAGAKFLGAHAKNKKLLFLSLVTLILLGFILQISYGKI